MCLDIVEETGYEGDARYTKPIYVVPMVAKFLDDKKSKLHIKSESALF